MKKSGFLAAISVVSENHRKNPTSHPSCMKKSGFLAAISVVSNNHRKNPTSHPTGYF
ncbi:MAG: hypothetical protein HC836_01080 [Richelia sp. RM2_1_2]|nr:hypothetical protein [Richelia sp. RM1_1_1]NJO57011.1 hypothetical protein [Richelia sp. RM2_1_2]